MEGSVIQFAKNPIDFYSQICSLIDLVKKFEGKLTVTVNKKVEGDELIISHLDFVINITEATDKEKARNFLEKAFKICPVTNSIKAGKTYHININ